MLRKWSQDASAAIYNHRNFWVPVAAVSEDISDAVVAEMFGTMTLPGPTLGQIEGGLVDYDDLVAAGLTDEFGDPIEHEDFAGLLSVILEGAKGAKALKGLESSAGGSGGGGILTKIAGGDGGGAEKEGFFSKRRGKRGDRKEKRDTRKEKRQDRRARKEGLDDVREARARMAARPVPSAASLYSPSSAPQRAVASPVSSTAPLGPLPGTPPNVPPAVQVYINEIRRHYVGGSRDKAADLSRKLISQIYLSSNDDTAWGAYVIDHLRRMINA